MTHTTTELRNRINKLEHVIILEALILWQANIGKPDEDKYRLSYTHKVDESYNLICKYFNLYGSAPRMGK